jgi:hypothetical protein
VVRNLNPGYFGCFTPICSCGESRLLISWCVGDRCDMAGSDEDLGRSRRPDADDQGWSSTGQVLSGQTIGRSGDAVCGLYHAQGDEERGFLGLASKPRWAVCQWFGFKATRTGLVIWASKSLQRFLSLDLKTGGYSLVIWVTKSPQWFLSLGLKTKCAMVCQLRIKIDRRMKMV